MILTVLSLAVALLALVSPSLQLPIVSRSVLPEPRCLLKGKKWGKCDFEPYMPIDSFHSFDDLQIEEDIRSGQIPLPSVKWVLYYYFLAWHSGPSFVFFFSPQPTLIRVLFFYSSVKCYALKFFGKDSTSPCPATCKLATGSRSNGECPNLNTPDRLLQVHTPYGTPIVTVQSTDYDCSKSGQRYPRRHMCLYNIDMSTCDSGMVRVNDASKLNITANSTDTCTDFIQVLHNEEKRTHKKVCGTSWPSDLSIIQATRFSLLFWSGQEYGNRSTGFKLQIECHKQTVAVTDSNIESSLVSSAQPSLSLAEKLAPSPSVEPSPTPSVEPSENGSGEFDIHIWGKKDYMLYLYAEQQYYLLYIFITGVL